MDNGSYRHPSDFILQIHTSDIISLALRLLIGPFIQTTMEVTVKTAEQLRLTAEEFELIKQKLGRTPNFNELCAFSGMWSEHCSYKNSIK